MREQPDNPSAGRHPDDERAEAVAARMALEVDDGPAGWELLARTFHDAAPFTTLMDYALGVTMWTAREDARRDGGDGADRDVRVDIPVVCLVALALYSVAAEQRVYEADRVLMRPAVALLSDDQQARQVAALLPGLDDEPDGRLRELDRAALAEAVKPEKDAQWGRWRKAALHALTTNVADSSWSTMPGGGPSLRSRLSQVRWMRIRRNWYEHPDLSPVVPDEDGSEAMR